jgi:hypothetical protein
VGLEHSFDEDLVRRPPLPLARLYRRAQNAKSPFDRHQAAYFLCEAALRLLASTAVVRFAEQPEHDPALVEALKKLARPSLGDWWGIVRRLIPVLADAGDAGFTAVRALVLDRARDDLPRAAELDQALCESLGIPAGPRARVRVSELFDRLVRYRNREIGHGTPGLKPGEFYERMGRVLLSSVAELLGRLDVLAGRRLVYVEEVAVQRRPSGITSTISNRSARSRTSPRAGCRSIWVDWSTCTTTGLTLPTAKAGGFSVRRPLPALGGSYTVSASV